jgi:DNA-binding LytR/AlgR family response regulator
MNIAVVDDIPEETLRFREVVKEYSELNRTEAEISCFGSAEEFLADYAPLKYTLIIMDIYMGGMTGLEAVQKIREQDKDALIVFLSSSSDHYPEAFRLHVYDFLQKPTEKKRIFELLDDIMTQETETGENLEFICEKETVRLPYSRVAALCASGHYSDITDDKAEVWNSHNSYSSLYGLLSADRRFLEINRGITVNMDMITEFSDGICCLRNGTKFSMNVKRRKSLEQTWQNYILTVMRNETVRRK